MYFSSILVKNFALAKVLTLAHEIPKTPYLQRLSALFDFAELYA